MYSFGCPMLPWGFHSKEKEKKKRWKKRKVNVKQTKKWKTKANEIFFENFKWCTKKKIDNEKLKVKIRNQKSEPKLKIKKEKSKTEKDQWQTKLKKIMIFDHFKLWNLNKSAYEEFFFW